MWKILSKLSSPLHSYQTSTRRKGIVKLMQAPGEIKRPDTHNRGRPKATGNAKI